MIFTQNDEIKKVFKIYRCLQTSIDVMLNTKASEPL